MTSGGINSPAAALAVSLTASLSRIFSQPASMSPTPDNRIRLPRWAGGREVSWTLAFAGMFLLTNATRSLLLSVVPLEAYSRTGSAGAVSLMYVCASVGGVLVSLSLPALILKIRTRGVFLLGLALAGISPILLSIPSLPVFLIGMGFWVVCATTFEVTLNLYILHHVRRRELGLFEPKRLLFAVTAFSVGPWLGVFLRSEVHHYAPFAAASLITLLTYAYFRWLGLGEAGARNFLRDSPNPLRHLKRFFEQPRLRLAWAIGLARTGWWTVFFVYTPIYAVTSGLGEQIGGALTSLGVASVYSVAWWGHLGRKHGQRVLLVFGFVASGIASICVALFADSPWLGAALILLAAFCTAIIDGAGNVAFLRAVRPLERERMTGVYATYRDSGQIIAPAMSGAVLLFAPVVAAFGAAGVCMLGMAWLCRYLPRPVAMSGAVVSAPGTVTGAHPNARRASMWPNVACFCRNRPTRSPVPRRILDRSGTHRDDGRRPSGWLWCAGHGRLTTGPDSGCRLGQAVCQSTPRDDQSTSARVENVAADRHCRNSLRFAAGAERTAG